MIVAQFVNGVGQSTGWSLMVKFTSQTEVKARAIGILSSAVPAGAFLSFVVASFLAEKIGINHAFIFPAFLLSVMAILSFYFLPAGRSDEISLGFVRRFIEDRNIAILPSFRFSSL